MRWQDESTIRPTVGDVLDINAIVGKARPADVVAALKATKECAMARHLVLDIRGLEPPEPMERVLTAIADFGQGDDEKRGSGRSQPRAGKPGREIRHGVARSGLRGQDLLIFSRFGQVALVQCA